MPEAKRSFICPNCGGVVNERAAACPYCGSDEQTGWSRNTYLDGMSFLDDDVDDEELAENEFPSHAPRRRVKITSKMIAGAIVLLYFIAGIVKFVM
jgi:hypothetical protein